MHDSIKLFIIYLFYFIQANALKADSVHAEPAGQSFGGRLHRWNHRSAQEPRLETPHDHHPALEY